MAFPPFAVKTEHLQGNGDLPFSLLLTVEDELRRVAESWIFIRKATHCCLTLLHLKCCYYCLQYIGNENINHTQRNGKTATTKITCEYR